MNGQCCRHRLWEQRANRKRLNSDRVELSRNLILTALSHLKSDVRRLNKLWGKEFDRKREGLWRIAQWSAANERGLFSSEITMSTVRLIGIASRCCRRTPDLYARYQSRVKSRSRTSAIGYRISAAACPSSWAIDGHVTRTADVTLRRRPSLDFGNSFRIQLKTAERFILTAPSHAPVSMTAARRITFYETALSVTGCASVGPERLVWFIVFTPAQLFKTYTCRGDARCLK